MEQVTRLDSAYGRSYEVEAVEIDRKVVIEWSDRDNTEVSITLQERPMGLATIGLDYDTLVKWDENKSLDNSFPYEGQQYNYENSHEVLRAGQGQGYWLWRFIRNDRKAEIRVVKWEGLPFEVYASHLFPASGLTVYKK